jgi:hypothetical protein
VLWIQSKNKAFVLNADGELNVLHDILARDGDLDTMEADDDESIDSPGNKFSMIIRLTFCFFSDLCRVLKVDFAVDV